MAAHKYKVGQMLSYSPSRLSSNEGSRQCKVVLLLPAQEDGQLQYRIKCTAETVERVVKEAALSRRA